MWKWWIWNKWNPDPKWVHCLHSFTYVLVMQGDARMTNRRVPDFTFMINHRHGNNMHYWLIYWHFPFRFIHFRFQRTLIDIMVNHILRSLVRLKSQEIGWTTPTRPAFYSCRPRQVSCHPEDHVRYDGSVRQSV